MKWIEALKEWNAQREGPYMVPRKGSPEHEEVTELMRGGAKKPYVPTGRSKKAGYVRLLWAKRVLNQGPADYPPPSRDKSAAKKIVLSKIAEPGATLVSMFGSKKQKEELAKRKTAAEKRRDARAAQREAAAEGIEPEELNALMGEMGEAAAELGPATRKPRAKKAPAMVTVLPPKPKEDIRGFFTKVPKVAKAAPAPAADTIEHIVEEESPSFAAAQYSAPTTNFPTAADWKGMRTDQKRRFLNIAQSMLKADPDSAVPAHIKAAVKRSIGQYASEVKKIGVPDVAKKIAQQERSSAITKAIGKEGPSLAKSGDYPKWELGVHYYEGDIVEDNGRLYRAEYDTFDEPPSFAWNIIKEFPRAKAAKAAKEATPTVASKAGLPVPKSAEAVRAEEKALKAAQKAAEAMSNAAAAAPASKPSGKEEWFQNKYATRSFYDDFLSVKQRAARGDFGGLSPREYKKAVFINFPDTKTMTEFFEDLHFVDPKAYELIHLRGHTKSMMNNKKAEKRYKDASEVKKIGVPNVAKMEEASKRLAAITKAVGERSAAIASKSPAKAENVIPVPDFPTVSEWEKMSDKDKLDILRSNEFKTRDYEMKRRYQYDLFPTHIKEAIREYQIADASFPKQEEWKRMFPTKKWSYMDRARQILRLDPLFHYKVPEYVKKAIAQDDAKAAAGPKPKKGGAKKKAAPKTIRATASRYTYSADQAKKDKTALGVKAAAKKMPVKEQGQISVMMKIGNHTMVAEPQPATIKVRGSIGDLPTDADYPTSGLDFSGFENRPQATTAKQAQRKFNAEETKVKPLSELFMSRPQKGLVEEQLQGKGREWWQRELQEF